MSRGRGLGWIALLASAAGCSRPPEPAPRAEPTPSVFYEDVAGEAGLTLRNVCGTPSKPFIVEAMGAGACWLDYDRDQVLDVFIVQGSTFPPLVPLPAPSDRLYRGTATGRFEDVTELAGIRESDWGGGCATGDYDNDGWPDVYVSNHGPNRLWRNLGNGRFEDTTQAAGVGDPGWGASVAFADLDADGLLDLFVTNYVAYDWRKPPVDEGANLCVWHALTVFCGPRGLAPSRPVFYRNRGDASFEDRSEAAGFHAAPASYGLGVVPFDFDRDGLLDLYVANDARPNAVWHNLGDGRFEEKALVLGAALSDAGKEQAGMGVDAGDYDSDGWPDLFVTNFSEDSFTLYHNDAGSFADVSVYTGIASASYLPLGWGAKFLDFDLDGDLDLAAVNGHVYPSVADAGIASLTWRQRPLLLENRGARFVDIAEQAGPGLAQAYPGRGLAVADYDNDGDLDLLIITIDEPPVLLRRRGGPDRHWLGIELEGRRSSRDASGAQLVLRAPGLKDQYRLATSAGSYLSGSDPRIHFGLGSASAADLRVEWPSGEVSELIGLQADRYWRVVEGDPRPRELLPPARDRAGE